jgi:putative ubiquitin-RnfH superfamily antitoxin RatB of RatAB toxin-antitoxin module
MICIEVVYSPEPGQVERVEVRLPEGSLLSQALDQSQLLQKHGLSSESLRTGIWGRRQGLTTPLRDKDRVEVYRDLRCDPKEARRLRYKKRPKATSL